MAVIDSLVAYWSLEEASGNRADAHGSSTLTDNNTVTSTTGKVGTCGQFTASTSEYLQVADNAALSMGDFDFSIAAWVYADSLTAPGGAASIVSKYQGSDMEYELRYQASASFRLVVTSGTGYANSTSVQSSVTPSTSTWYFLVARHDATANTIDIQVNGGSVDSTGYTHGSFDSGSFLRMGSDGDNLYWDGRIDEVGIWKKKLTADEATWLYNAGAGRSYADITAEGAGVSLPVLLSRASSLGTGAR